MTQFPAQVTPIASPVREGELLWKPTPAQAGQTNMAKFTTWLAEQRGKRFADYASLWQWSVTDIEGFWQAMWDYFSVPTEFWRIAPCPVPIGFPARA